MAQRRMFSPDIVESDAFLEMPATAHSLYFHLGMYADDDGFVSPRKIMRLLGSSEDDIKVLVSKNFVLPFENGVIVIKHWKMNNLVRKDWYRPTQYIEQKKQLYVKENGAYTLDSGQGIPLVNEPLTTRQRSIGKDSKGISIASSKVYVSEDEKPSKKKRVDSHILRGFVLVGGSKYPKFWEKVPAQRDAMEWLMTEKGEEQIVKAINFARENKGTTHFPEIDTPYDLQIKWEKLLNAKERV